jgi:hypothetical protein
VGCGLNSTGSGQGPVAGCCECGDEPSGSCATELVRLSCLNTLTTADKDTRTQKTEILYVHNLIFM